MMRFYVSPDGLTGEWRHELDPPPLAKSDWHDCTDMNDDQFAEFVTALQTLV